MAKPRTGRYERDCTTNIIISRLKNRRNEFYSIDELITLTELTRAGIFSSLRTIVSRDTWILRFQYCKDHQTVTGVALFIDRRDIMRDSVYNPACWKIPNSLKTRGQ